MGSAEDLIELTKKRYKSSFESYLGVEFHKYCDGCCEISLDITPDHLNIGGTVHGGVIESLLDIALSGAVTSNFTDTADRVVTMQMNVNFLRAGKLGEKLTCIGQVIKKGRTIYYVEGEIKNPEGKLVAKASGDWFIKRTAQE